MKRNKVREVQDYLRARGIEVSETTIVNAAIDIARRLGAGDDSFVCEFEDKKNEEDQIQKKQAKKEV